LIGAKITVSFRRRPESISGHRAPAEEKMDAGLRRHDAERWANLPELIVL
jgi:hypothetical protein